MGVTSIERKDLATVDFLPVPSTNTQRNRNGETQSHETSLCLCLCFQIVLLLTTDIVWVLVHVRECPNRMQNAIPNNRHCRALDRYGHLLGKCRNYTLLGNEMKKKVIVLKSGHGRGSGTTVLVLVVMMYAVQVAAA